MDKLKRDGRGDPGPRPGDRTPNDSRAQTRELTRNQGLDPGEDVGPSEPDDGFTGPPFSPTLEQMTRRMDHPPIAPVGQPRMPKYGKRGDSVGKASS